MSLGRDILTAYLQPRVVYRAKRDQPGMREGVALAYLILACLVMLAARLPDIPPLAGPERPLAGLLAANLVGFLILGPLLLYLVAGISHLVLRTAGGRGDGLSSRLALFWAIMVSTPAVLAAAVLRQSFPASPLVAQLADAVTFGVFLWQWVRCLQEAHFPRAPAPE